MTEKNKNSNSESFLSSENASYLEHLQKKHSTDNIELEQSWKNYFNELNALESGEFDGKISPAWFRSDWPPSPKGEFISAIDGQWNVHDSIKVKTKIEEKAAEINTFISENSLRQAVLDSIRALMIIRAYRIRGHQFL